MTPTGVVVDVGGTTTRLSLHDGDRLVGPVVRFATPSPRTDPDSPLESLRGALFDRIAAHAGRLCAGRPVERLGVAFGAVVSNAGVVRDASVLWLRPCTGFDVADAVRARLPRARVTVLNDVSAAAWHYRRLGSFALATVSTGLAVKVFDAGAPVHRRLLLDPAGVGGESGHTVVEPTLVRRLPAALRAAVAAGDPAAREELERLGLPWCECGAVADLCAYASGPAVARSAAASARRDPDRFARSLLSGLTGGDPALVDPATIAAAARSAWADRIEDPFVDEVLHGATRALAARLLQLCADVGLRTVVVVGGFAHGVGPPWLAALRRNLAELAVRSGWYAGWSDADLDGMVTMPPDADDAPLHGIAAYVTARAERMRVAVKPVGEGRLVLRDRPRPRCGREQVVLRPVYAGICGTDLQMLRGERGCEPGIPGHEVVAEVVQVGEEVAGARVGDLVTLNPNNPRDDDDKIGHSRPGVFGELLVFDAGVVRRGQVVRVPGPARAEHVLLEPLAGVLRARTMTAGAAAGNRVLVVGAGVAGLLHALVARHHGARTVLVASRSAVTRARAVELGVCPPAHALALDGTLADAVAAATAGAGVDTAVIAVGGRAGPASAESTWPALADGAALHLFGGFPAGSRLPLADGRHLDVGPLRAAAGTRTVTTPVGRSTVVMGSRGGRAADFAAAVALCEARPDPLPVGRLVSHVVSLAALPAVAAELAATGTVDGRPAVRAVVDFRLDGQVVDAVADAPPAVSGAARRG